MKRLASLVESPFWKVKHKNQQFLLFALLCFVSGASPNWTQDVLLALKLGISPGSALGTIWGANDWTWLTKPSQLHVKQALYPLQSQDG